MEKRVYHSESRLTPLRRMRMENIQSIFILPAVRSKSSRYNCALGGTIPIKRQENKITLPEINGKVTLSHLNLHEVLPATQNACWSLLASTSSFRVNWKYLLEGSSSHSEVQKMGQTSENGSDYGFLHPWWFREQKPCRYLGHTLFGYLV